MNLDPYRNELPPRREVLPGGAVLLSTPIRSAHAVTLGVWLRTGSQDEPADLGGISHFLEHMVFKGSRKRSAYEIALTFDRLGAAVDAFTTKDLVAFTIKVLPEYFREAAELLAEMLLQPAFDPRLTELEQNVVIEEIQEALDTPEDRLHDAFAARVYGAHRRGRPILGTPDSLRSFGPDILAAQHRRLFAPTNLVISMAGNIQDGFESIVAAAFDEPARPGPERDAVAPSGGRAAAMIDFPPGEGLDPFRLDLASPIIQSYFEIGNLGPAYLHPDRIPVFLLTNILGGGMSSRIFQAVREREGLAYTVYNYNDMGRDTGLVSCAGSCSPEKLGRLEDVIRMEYQSLISDGVSEDELENNRAQIKSQLIFSLEGTVNQMYRAARNEIYYGAFQPVAGLVDRVDSLTAADIVRCAEAYFDPSSVLVAVHGPEGGVRYEDEGLTDTDYDDDDDDL
ncbi:insulinase family protein [bacterium]|nr:insulinase family protein [bacterium]